MKPELDREIDALLRSRAGRADARRDEPSRLGSAELAGPRPRHLDADELAAFAEGALPAAARARYSAHLADCDDCRRTATQIALAGGVVNARDEREAVVAVATEKGSVAEKSVAFSWRERVAAFFAPSAWRYAMPVVALLCVGVIALVVMRRVPNPATQMARSNEAARTNANSAESASPVVSDQNHATAAADQLADVSTKTQGSATNAPAYDDKAQPQEAERGTVAANNQAPSQAAGNATGGATAGTLGTVAGAASSDASAGAAARRAGDQPTPAPPPPAAAPMVATRQAPETQPPPPAAEQVTVIPEATPTPPNEDRSQIAKDERAKQAEEVAVTEREQTKARRARAKSGETSAGAAAASPRALDRTALRNEPAANDDAPASGSAAAAPKESRKPAARDDKKKDEDKARNSAGAGAGETRAVAGRHFRREGDAWIDTAYRGEATTVVRRGTEQYRALAADEPGIARVASSLGGEVVVVWKGRAYRIR